MKIFSIKKCYDINDIIIYKQLDEDLYTRALKLINRIGIEKAYLISLYDKKIGLLIHDFNSNKKHVVIYLYSMVDSKLLKKFISTLTIKDADCLYYFIDRYDIKQQIFTQHLYKDAHLSMIYKNNCIKKNHKYPGKNYTILTTFEYDKIYNFFNEVFKFEKYVDVKSWLDNFIQIDVEKQTTVVVNNLTDEYVSCILSHRIDSITEYIYLAGTNSNYRNLGIYTYLFDLLCSSLSDVLEIKLGVWESSIAYKIYLKQGFNVSGYNTFLI